MTRLLADRDLLAPMLAAFPGMTPAVIEDSPDWLVSHLVEVIRG